MCLDMSASAGAAARMGLRKVETDRAKIDVAWPQDAVVVVGGKFM